MSDDEGIAIALELAREALLAGEPPFGALVADRSGNILAKTTDRVRTAGDMTRHAEIEAIRAASAVAGPDLSGCALFTSCEPCPMCFTAAWLARISKITWGCSMADVAEATKGSQRELSVPASRMNELGGNELELRGGVRAASCLALFQAAP